VPLASNGGYLTPRTQRRFAPPVALLPRTLYALQVLDLIDENGAPTETFEAIRLAPEAEYKRRLEDWLKSAYADVFSFVDPSTDDETSIRDAFRSYQPIGQQPRMVTLFQGLAKAAGLLPEKADSARPASRPRPTHPAAKRSAPKPKVNPPPGGGSTEMPPAIAGLMASLPTGGEGWTQATRDRFVESFKAVLDFCVPVVEPAESGEEENGGRD